MKILQKTTVPEYFESIKFSATEDDTWVSTDLKDLTCLICRDFTEALCNFMLESDICNSSESHSGYHRVQELHHRQQLQLPNGLLLVQHFCSKIKFIKSSTVRDLFFQLSGKADFMV